MLFIASLSVSGQSKYPYHCSQPKFKLTFPGEFIESWALDADSLPTLEVFSEQETMIFAVSVSQSKDPITEINARYLADKALADLVEALEAKKVKEKAIMNGRAEGVEAELLIPAGGNSIQVRVFAKGKHIFIIYVVSLLPTSSPSEQAKSFFDSFKIK